MLLPHPFRLFSPQNHLKTQQPQQKIRVCASGVKVGQRNVCWTERTRGDKSQRKW